MRSFLLTVRQLKEFIFNEITVALLYHPINCYTYTITNNIGYIPLCLCTVIKIFKNNIFTRALRVLVERNYFHEGKLS